MPLQYKVIEVFTSEEARWQGKPLHSAIVEYVNGLKIPARTIVTQGIEGSYETGEMTAGRLEALSSNLPVRITIILPAADYDPVLSRVEQMLPDGIIAAREVEVIAHKTRGELMPRRTRVREIMTPNPKRVQTTTSLDEVARILLSSAFTGVPVVDEANRPVGVIAQGDLIYKGGLPMRLGLLAESERERVSAVLESLASKQAGDVMSQPVITIGEDRFVTEVVDIMLRKGVKRVPAVDAGGKLVGIVSRLDVFSCAMRQCPDWAAFQRQSIHVEGVRYVSDIMRRDTHTVLPETPVEEVLRIIDCNDIQRVCVVNREGYFLGLISDRDLLVAFSGRHPGIWDYFVSRIPFTERGRLHRELKEHLRVKTAAEVMNANIVTVREDTPIKDAIRLMLERAIKRLPVLDADGKFMGMISRDSLLRVGFGAAESPPKS